MKSVFQLIGISALVLGTTMSMSSCSSGGEAEEVVGNGLTAYSFASGANSFTFLGTTAFTLRPVAATERVDETASRVVGVEGVVEVNAESIPVFLSYTTKGDPATTGIVTATIDITLDGTDHVANANFLKALGSPEDGEFMDASIAVNYLSNTVTITSRAIQPISIDPDAPGVGDIITGIDQPQTSISEGLRMFINQL